MVHLSQLLRLPVIAGSGFIVQGSPCAGDSVSAEIGFPQSSLISYVWDEERLWFSTKRSAIKVRNVQDRPQVGFVVVDPGNPYHYLEIRGIAIVADDPGCAGRDLMRAKYGMDVSAPDAFAADRVLVTIAVSRVVVH